MHRRTFLQHSLLASSSLGLGLSSCFPENELVAGHQLATDPFHQLCTKLLATWGKGMLAFQINAPADPTVHGSLDCPVCDNIHGRCMDAV
ncbi:MAG: hypothetical protein AAGA31_04840, partial [Bacteroidota bacterium]